MRPLSTKITSGRAENKQASLIKTGSIPSICPRVAGEAQATAGMSSLSGVVVSVKDIPYFVGPDASLRSSGPVSFLGFGLGCFPLAPEPRRV